MKNNIRQFATVFGLSALLGTAALVAQTHRAVARIPFGFHVKDSVLPAGRYDVAQETSGVLEVRSESTGKTTVVMAAGRSLTNRKDAHLTFNRYGNEYFLSEVTLPDSPVSAKIPPSSREKEAAKGSEIAAVVSLSLNGE